jgi:uncharacterized protein (DUF983 family)
MIAVSAQPERFSRIGALLRQRCPRCGEGRIFRSTFASHDRCPVCDLPFQRGPGYYTGAMYFSYALGIPIIGLLTLLAYLILPDRPLYQLVVLAWLAFLPLVPAVYRYSRVLWIHFDRMIDPGN